MKHSASEDIKDFKIPTAELKQSSLSFFEAILQSWVDLPKSILSVISLSDEMDLGQV